MEFINSVIDIIINIDKYVVHLYATYHTWVFVILFIVLFCETGLVVAPFLPGDTLLFIAGTLTALPTSEVNIHVIVLGLMAAPILGDAMNYAIGHRLGEKLFQNPNSRVFKQSYLDKTHLFYEKYGGKTIVIARFVPIVRTFAPFVAGMGKMPYRQFSLYNVAGGVVWVASFTYTGFLLGNSLLVQHHFNLLLLAIMAMSLLPALFETVRVHFFSAKKD